MTGPTPTSELDYELPEERIAQSAIEPRDASRLLVVDGMRDAVFRDLPTLLRAGDLLVVNRTRVRAARLSGHKTGTGGAVELLLLRRTGPIWEALIKPARRIRMGTELDLGPLHGLVTSDPMDGVISVELAAPDGEDVDDLLPRLGSVPLPPYFRGSLSTPDRYQTMFAKSIGSAAAPTAALHFTPALVESLADAGVSMTEVELEVGLDTFRPISTDTVEAHQIHSERYAVPEHAVEAIETTRRGGGRVVAVGTTVVRTLETASEDGGLVAGDGVSSLFITPGFRFGVVDALVTNFHAPQTSLIALIAAAIGPGWRDVYETALARGYRFLSFGDAMLVEGLR